MSTKQSNIDPELYKKIALLVNSFVNTHQLTIDEFLINALNSAFELIPEAEKGSLYVLHGENYLPVCTKGYDINLINRLSFTKDNIFIGFECADVNNIESYENYIEKRIDEAFDDYTLETFKLLGTYSNFTSLYAPIQFDSMVIGLISLEKFTNKAFSMESKEVLRFYAQMISNFYALKIKAEREQALHEETIMALVTAIEVKDIYTEGHARRVMDYSEKLSRTLNLPQSEIDKIKTAALLHDVGKIGIPNEILNKPFSLEFEEYELVKKHPEDTKRILDKITGLSDVVTLAYMHHEHYDGSGYPQGLKSDQIPMGAHIIQLADAFDAMTSKRAYREAMPIEIAIEVLKSCSGTQFHPEVVEAAINYYTSYKSKQSAPVHEERPSGPIT